MLDFNIILSSYLELYMLNQAILYIDGKLRKNSTNFVLKPKPNSAISSLESSWEVVIIYLSNLTFPHCLAHNLALKGQLKSN